MSAHAQPAAQTPSYGKTDDTPHAAGPEASLPEYETSDKYENGDDQQ